MTKRDTTMRRMRERTHFASDGCWNWTGPTVRGGYGSITSRGKRRPTHRISYEFFNGPIPGGLTIDHLCRNKACLNPDHLEAVTMRENILRSENRAALNSRKTHCLRGHPLSGDNLLSGDGRRRCLECRRQRGRVISQRWRDDKKAAGLTSGGTPWKRPPR